ncbi:MAG TPA: DUF3343 domain-containing protein [Clostridiales bacterium]|nr:DUF3343 domain-containing protein [Clostridiales bacterium]
MEKYFVVFASNYHGYYIEELLRRHGIKSSLRKAPSSVVKSCHFAIYLREQDFQRAIQLIQQTQIKIQGVYKITEDGYQKIG